MNGELIVRHAEPVMGTVVSFDLRPRGLPYEHTRLALDQACAILHRADEVFSLYVDDSPMSRLRRGELALADAPTQVAEVLDLCAHARALSGGWFDPWALPGGLDPTGLVKGWAAAEAGKALQSAGLDAAMINAAGDIVTFGRPAADREWQVAVRSPHAPDQLLGVVPVQGAIATSGGYERGAHIYDVRHDRPADAALSATVCGPDLAVADALATGLVAAGAAGVDAVELAGYEALIVGCDGSISWTAGFRVLGLCEPV